MVLACHLACHVEAMAVGVKDCTRVGSDAAKCILLVHVHDAARRVIGGVRSMERHFQQPWLFISCIVDFTQVLDGRPPHPRRGMKVLVQRI